MPRKHPRRATGQNRDDTPVLLPHAVITVDEAGTLAVTLDGTPFPAPEGSEWTRATFGPLLDAITADRTITVRIEVHESDGSVFTDIIHGRRRTTPEPLDETDSEANRGRQARHKGRQRLKRAALVELTGEGFVPGEDVAIAVIVSHTHATPSGRARTLLDRAQLRSVLAKNAGEVVLFGRISGTLHVRRLP